MVDHQPELLPRNFAADNTLRVSLTEIVMVSIRPLSRVGGVEAKLRLPRLLCRSQGVGGSG